MDAFDLDVRRHVYFSVVANARPPTTAETASFFEIAEEAAAVAYGGSTTHAFVLFPDTRSVSRASSGRSGQPE